jgi:competence protein ComEA
LTSRQRGAALVLAALVAGRILDRFDSAIEATAPAGAVDSIVRGPVASPRTHVVRDASHPAAAATDVDSSAARARPREPAKSAGDNEPVPINLASAAELERLPGVGPVLAARIVADRVARGRFRDVSDLQRVRGIGPRSAARLAPRLRFD